MGSESGGRDYDLTEIFAIKFVVADVLIIAALLLAGPLYALAITALFVVSTFLVWHLTRRDTPEHEDADSEATVADRAETEAGSDPVTKLQERYAAGELSDAEFEAKLDRLIDSNERAEAAGIDTDDLELELERSD